MADYWLHWLVVQGPRRDVTAFRRAATANRTSRSKGSRLSFKRLMSILLSSDSIDQNLLWVEPLDLDVGSTRDLQHGMVEVVYSFQLRGAEIEPLLIEVSRHYPRLCFILGTVSPSTDEQESRLIDNGREQLWQLPASQKEKIVAPVIAIMERLEAMNDPSDEDEDESFWASVQADAEMMVAVVDHWDGVAKKQLARIAADMETDGPTEPKRPPRLLST